ncbi:MAG TPA: type III pantothenate kinase [Nitrosomonas halophila]|nr:type III pantothenate kinase [Nitrosomonas halophila]
MGAPSYRTELGSGWSGLHPPVHPVEETELNDSSCLLAIDSGNTAIKWGVYAGDRWVARGMVPQRERMQLAQAWSELPAPGLIVVSNVAGSLAAKELEMLLEKWSAPSMWIKAKARQCGVQNRYASPGQLGSDRWASLIAAWHSLRQGCLVVNAGTAMTVDALTDAGEFLGGIIVPGFHLMRQVLPNQTGALSVSTSDSFQKFPRNTGDALYSGAIQALVGALERMCDLLVAHSNKGNLTILLSGGDAALLSAHLQAPHQVVDNLVLEGLVVMAREPG